MASTIAAPLALSEAAAGAGAACSAMIETLADAASGSVRRASREVLRPPDSPCLGSPASLPAGSRSAGNLSGGGDGCISRACLLSSFPCGVGLGVSGRRRRVLPSRSGRCGGDGRLGNDRLLAWAAGLAASRLLIDASRGRDCCSSSVPSEPAASAAFDPFDAAISESAASAAPSFCKPWLPASVDCRAMGAIVMNAEIACSARICVGRPSSTSASPASASSG